MHSILKFLSKLNLIIFFICFSIIQYLSTFNIIPLILFKRARDSSCRFILQQNRTILVQTCTTPLHNRTVLLTPVHLFHLSRFSAGSMPVYRYPACNSSARATLDLAPATRCLGPLALLQLPIPCSTTVHTVYFFSLNLCTSPGLLLYIYI